MTATLNIHDEALLIRKEAARKISARYAVLGYKRIDVVQEATIAALTAPAEVNIDLAIEQHLQSRFPMAPVGSLTELEREALELLAQGRTYTEIAAALGRNAKAIDNAIQRARAKMLGEKRFA